MCARRRPGSCRRLTCRRSLLPDRPDDADCPSAHQRGEDEMSLFDAFRYDGKRALVVGAASGMGAATAEVVQEAGAEVVAMDFAEITLPGAKAVHVNLADKASID